MSCCFVPTAVTLSSGRKSPPPSDRSPIAELDTGFLGLYLNEIVEQLYDLILGGG